MSDLSIRALLPADFASSFWRRRPLLLRGAAGALTTMVTDDEIDAFEEDFFAAPASWRTNSVGRIGTTSYIANGECLNSLVAEFCVGFREEFQWPHAEVSLVRNRERTSWVPSGPHFDQVDNFIVQSTGVKQWRIWSTAAVSTDEKRRRILKLPQYGEVAIPEDATDLVEITMYPGDLLYLPLFWGHSVRSLGPGTMLSINLKALTAGQVLLHGLAQNLAEVDEDAAPVPLPIEVDDWHTEMAGRMSKAFEQVSRALVPEAADGSRATGPDLAVAGLNTIASARHQLLLKQPAPMGELNIGRLLPATDERIAVTGLDLSAVFQSRPQAAPLVGLLDAFALVHLRRFLSLLALGPQPWWAANVRDGWAAARADIESADRDSLLNGATDPVLVEMTSRFRADVVAFNRRHAVESLAAWWQSFTTRSEGAGFAVHDDAMLRLPADLPARKQVDDALAFASAVWPGFADAFGTVIRGVVVDPLGRQSRVAAQRFRLAVIAPTWSVEETAAALVGELFRTSAQMVARIGAVKPSSPSPYGGGPSSLTEDMLRGAAMAGVAAFHRSAGQETAASVAAGTARHLVLHTQQGELTGLGRMLCDAAQGLLADSEGVPPHSLREVLAEVEAVQSNDIRELVEGHCWANARFRWSDLRRDDQSDLEDIVPAGMDVSLTPWLVSHDWAR